MAVRIVCWLWLAGSFVFYWGEKQETTHTWYGLFRGGQNRHEGGSER